jgi:hypothetical protein
VLYGGLFTATLVTSYASLLHVDGYANVLMPYHAVVSLCAGLGLGRLLTHPREPVAAAFGAALLVHFATLYHDRGPLLPTRADVAGGQAMISALRDSKGPLLVLGSGFYGAMAGHPELNAHPMALLDVLKTHDSARKDALTDSIVHAIQDKRYATVVTDRSIDFLPSRIKLQLQATYRIDRPLFPGDTAAALPKTGLAARPEWLWVPR